MSHTLVCGDFRDHFVDCDLCFGDPPDNLGLGYNGYKDNLPVDEYVKIFETLVELSCKHAPQVFISFNSRWTLEMAEAVATYKPNDYLFVPIIQTISFGCYQPKRLTNCHRPLWWLRHRDAKCNWEHIKVPSWRELNGDPRAKPGGKVPGDVWPLGSIEDAWDIPRVTGNSKQRRSFHPTQLNEALYERVIKLTTDEGATCMDCFGGTGTMLRVCHRLNRVARVVELDPYYCEKIREDNLFLAV